MRDLPLQRHDHSLGTGVRLRQFHQDGRADGERKVCHQYPIVPVGRFAAEEFQSVVVVQREVVRSRETLSQKFDQPPVLLDGQDFPGLGEQKFRQRSQPRPDFQNLIRSLQFCRRHNPAQLIAVVQEILAQRFA